MSAIILDGRVAAQQIHNQTRNRFATHPECYDHYIVVLLLTDDPASITYVRMKQRAWASVWLSVRIITHQDIGDLTITWILACIHWYNHEPSCLGIMVQLPLSLSLQSSYYEIMSSIDPYKDIDWLSWYRRGQSLIWWTTILPATPAGIFLLLEYYNIQIYPGQIVTIIGQSPVVWLPLVTAFIQLHATVYSINKWTDNELLRQCTMDSDIIISATGVPHLLGIHHISTTKKQTLIDVGRSRHDDIICGDIDYDAVTNHVWAITPVPGGVWPMTIAALLKTVTILYDLSTAKHTTHTTP